jgi:putative Mg2+ transporter-C (MgtC) family protein
VVLWRRSVCSSVSASDVDEVEIVGRLVLAALLGALLGAERELDGQDAGFRTHVMLALGAALFGAISVAGFDDVVDADTRFDPSRVASYVAAGIGFLGGGAIIKHAGSVHGMTTAASIWTTAAVGLAAGIGFLVGAVATTILSLFVLRGLKPVSHRIGRLADRPAISVVIGPGPDSGVAAVAEIIDALGDADVGAIDVESAGPDGERRVRIALPHGDRAAVRGIVARLESALGDRVRSTNVEA